MSGPIWIGIMGLVLVGISAWMHINKQDGSGWGLVAFFLIVASCSGAT